MSAIEFDGVSKKYGDRTVLSGLSFRIERGERWLVGHNRDPELLASLGRLCAQAELWGKARSFLEASLSFEETRAAHLELARLAERLGDPQEAQRHFRRGAELP